MTKSKKESREFADKISDTHSVGLNQSPLKKAEWLKLEALAKQTLQDAKARGASDAEVNISIESGMSATVRLGAVETIEFNHDKALGLTVYQGKRKGTVTTSDLSRAAIQSLVDKACRIAEYTEEDEASGLPEKDLLAKTILNLDLYYPEHIVAEQAIVWASECEEAAMSKDKRIVNSEGASFSSHEHWRVYANSLGFLGSYPTSRHSMSCAVVGKHKDSMQRDYDYTIARDMKDLDSWKKIGETAALRTVRRLDARKINTCQTPVIFEAEIARSLFAHFIAAISGGNLYRKASFLLDQIEKPVFPAFVHIEEVPHMKKALGSAPFDQEGVINRQHDIVTAGVLKSYVLSTYSARKLGLTTTGNCGGVHNLLLSHSNKDLTTLIKEMGKGLLVTELLGQGVNIITGDYSRGASGFWVENGEIQYPVEEITIAGNLKDMFLNLVAIGNDIERRGNIFTGSLLFEKMTVAGN